MSEVRSESIRMSGTPSVEVDRVRAANEAYATARSDLDDPRPSRHLAVVTCMDARIDVFAALGLHLGEAHVLRNAGGRVTDDVLRSLAVSTNLLGVDTVIVVQHTGCGLAGATEGELRTRTGADIEFLAIEDFASSLEQDVESLRTAAFLDLAVIAGFVYDVETGALEELVRWEREES
jgi:carbonic anhydrase